MELENDKKNGDAFSIKRENMSSGHEGGEKERRLKSLKSENNSGDITTGYIEIKRTIRE